MHRPSRHPPSRSRPRRRRPVALPLDLPDYLELMLHEDTPSPVACSQASWPASAIPVEIFEIITSYLTRSEVKTLRLVCGEFEAKVSGQYFRNVVVPFRSELYGEMNRDRNGNLIASTANLFSNGMRVFESFGPHILRFALSLELNEDDLAYPPIKPVQEAVPAFWGIYRWPHETYHRYTELEGLEQTADETDGMKEALNCLTKVINLGICCDPGLGYLLGPDGAACQNSALRHPVFATRDWRQDKRQATPDDSLITIADFSDVTRDPESPTAVNPARFKRRLLEHMISEAGYTYSQQEEAIQLMLETEHTDLHSIDFDERSTSMTHNTPELRSNLDPRFRRELESPVDTPRCPLIPTNLTRAQKELLLELEWAHRAMIQSFVICLIDNALNNRFDTLTTLTIAKIPSAHLHILNRDDLWSTLPSLKNVSLGVIADWRRVSKSTFGFIEDQAVSPVHSVGKVFKVLNSFIGAQENLESIHFEWICGGEFAPGRYQRNSYVLPAPFVHDPELMAAPRAAIDAREALLLLPHVRHLSLKNCWISPHVLVQTIRQMALSSLEKLELESVSMSGPPTSVVQVPLTQHPLLNNNNAVVQPHAVAVPAAPAGGNAALPAWAPAVLAPPHGAQVAPGGHLAPWAWGQPVEPEPETARQAPWSSWPGIIDHFSPGPKLDESPASQFMREEPNTKAERLEAMATYVPGENLYSDEKRYKLKHLSLRSCGYVAIDAPHLHTRAVVGHERPPLVEGSANYPGFDVGSMMQHSKDVLLGVVMPFLRVSEMIQLEAAFGMEFGWENFYDDHVAEDALADGVEFPGLGRFSGVLERRAEDIWAMDNATDSSETSLAAYNSDG